MPLLPPTDQQRQSTESNKTDNKTYNFTGRYMFSARKRRYNAATSELRAMERVYYVVTDDSDGGDDDVINSRRTDDAIGNCSGKPLGGGGTVPFRVLRAYRKRHRRHRRHDAAAAAPPTAPPMTSLPGAVANSHDAGGPEARREKADEAAAWTPPAGAAGRREVCVSFCKRFVAFLLSTVGLSMVAIAYSVAGGVLFAAVEAPHELAVKHGVRDALDWHVGELWRRTGQLNVLHPVGFLLTHLRSLGCLFL